MGKDFYYLVDGAKLLNDKHVPILNRQGAYLDKETNSVKFVTIYANRCQAQTMRDFVTEGATHG